MSKRQPHGMKRLATHPGGLATTGHERILDIEPETLHQRVPFMFGSREEVELIDDYHRHNYGNEVDAPLFGVRGLFRRKM